MLLVEFLIVPDELLHEVVNLHQGGVMHLLKEKRSNELLIINERTYIAIKALLYFL
jgi:hypothetical protein